MMDALDGNAIGGLLLEVFGAEMTRPSGRVRELRRAVGRWPSSPSTCARPAPSSAARAATAC